MADKKVSELTALTSPIGEDLLLIVDDPSGTPVSKKVTLNSFFGSVAANTTMSGTLTATANVTVSGSNTTFTSNVNIGSSSQLKVDGGVVTLGAKSTITSNNATTQLGSGGLQGSIFWDENYLYVATSNTVVKRVALSTFAS